MRELPLLCNTTVVKNILAGLQTQDRRPMKVQPKHCQQLSDGRFECSDDGGFDHDVYYIKPPRQVGDLLWVREKTRVISIVDEFLYDCRYEADNKAKMVHLPLRIKPIKVGNCVPNGCFKELARIWLEVTGVKCERIQSISEDDAIAEGIRKHHISDEYGTKINNKWLWFSDPRRTFKHLWNSIYPGSWDRNDWVWIYDFKLLSTNGRPE